MDQWFPATGSNGVRTGGGDGGGQISHLRVLVDGKGRTTAFGGRSGRELGQKGLFLPKEGYLGLGELQGPS